MDENKAKAIQNAFLNNTGMEYFHSRIKELHDSTDDEETRKKLRQAALERHIQLQNSLK